MACGIFHYSPAPPLNNHQHVPIQTNPTEYFAITPPNANLPNTSMRQPSAMSNIPSSLPSTRATSRHGLVFTQASSQNIFHNTPSLSKATSTKNKIIFVPLNIIKIYSTASTQIKNSTPTTFLPPSSTLNPRPPNHTPTKQDNSRSSLHVGTNTSFPYTTTKQTPSTPIFSKTGKPCKSPHPGRHATNTYASTVQPSLSTSSTMSAPTPCKKPSANTMLTSNLSPLTPTVATPQNV